MRFSVYLALSIALIFIAVLLGQASSQPIKVQDQRISRPAKLASKAVSKPITKRDTKPAPKPILKPLPSPINDFDDKHPDYHLHLPGKRDVSSFENYED